MDVRIYTHCVECHEDYTHLDTATVQITIMPDECSWLTWCCPRCVAPQHRPDPLPLDHIIDLLNLGVRVVDVSDVQPERHVDCGPIIPADLARAIVELETLLDCARDIWAIEQAEQ